MYEYRQFYYKYLEIRISFNSFVIDPNESYPLIS